MKTAFDEPEESDGPELHTDSIRGTNTPMEATDTKTYTVSDNLRISWLNHHLREAGMFKSVRDCINREEQTLDPDAVQFVKPYFSYLLHNEAGVFLEDSHETKWSVDANFGRNELYLTLKATV